ncbi:hypothetical protein SKAU_G00379410 [Synaphobranchus kaupii]|uniref:Uncharacterized protein n=1 Tax=Synaphobranchus kaupii TaxID=118154 RepID=A0A9Q1IEJ3_SYNKA|nr:hypothetical protein SKAU_G00379410 [Synaphobranchus kaupii]
MVLKAPAACSSVSGCVTSRTSGCAISSNSSAAQETPVRRLAGGRIPQRSPMLPGRGGLVPRDAEPPGARIPRRESPTRSGREREKSPTRDPAFGSEDNPEETGRRWKGAAGGGGRTDGGKHRDYGSAFPAPGPRRTALFPRHAPFLARADRRRCHPGWSVPRLNGNKGVPDGSLA